MAGFLETITKTQKPKVHKYTQELLERAKDQHGEESGAYRGIYNQYFRMPSTGLSVGNSTRHFEAVVSGDAPQGFERMYRRVVVIDMLSACASECVFCVRGLYDRHTLGTDQINAIADYLKSDEDLAEILVTGGDPLISPRKLRELLAAVASRADNISTVRMGTRLPVQNPHAFGPDVYEIFAEYADRFHFEISVQINHPFELQPEAVEVFQRLQRLGARLHSQNVLLKGVNDSIETLIELYDRQRTLRFIPHYLFHAVPMVGTDEFRTTVQRGLDLVSQLSNGGFLSGMAKPMYTVMTDIGKVTLYQGSILGKEDRLLTIRTSYRLEDRVRWNPSYQLPASATPNSAGTLDVTYIDGED
ncbi:lysine 2,3-aminomutase [Saccharopolyspora kobensis]|uniref:Lysine 2,3-aminomutase n=1 Tax=Saccharopolyspora kobensis TaxID=146035 RepID=A0A1H6A6B1_9PSEU|nr:radical SAM protein [Saccharopolyspora kobensis]SEG43880.1 lysine 2,3-aminomutase [Saccharopolyspora kobensis]SFE20211.1 lysine 2,3-aminomutase [Saccharopolyspora kobensis]